MQDKTFKYCPRNVKNMFLIKPYRVTWVSCSVFKALSSDAKITKMSPTIDIRG